MAAIKSYADLEQSKKLAEILPLETADMFYVAGKGEPIFIGNKMVAYGDDDYDALGGPDVLCWSLAALLKTLNFPSLTQNKEDEWEVCVFDHDNDDYIEKTASNPVDACYEMIMTVERKN